MPLNTPASIDHSISYSSPTTPPRRIVLLGATGSIGESVARVARALPQEMEIVGLSGNNNRTRLVELTEEFSPIAICTKEAAATSFVAQKLAHLKKKPVIFDGEEGLISLATLPEAELVIIAIVGTAGLQPALAALEAKKNLAVASKEILVMAGEQVMATAARNNARILPIDSEHSAIFQCLDNRDPSTIRRVIITCSGGPFRKTEEADLEHITPEMALRHPTWNMGRKITIDSATLFNKGLEMIEARWLFNLPMEKIDVVIHPQSIIHSMVEFVDGSIIAQLCQNNMMLPAQYAITYPRRVVGPCDYVDLPSIGTLSFEKTRDDVFPALNLARRAGIRGGTMPAVLNAANEAAVELFLERKIKFPEIWKSVEHAMNSVPFIEHPTLDELIVADHAARKVVVERA
ncbi:MAG: 1-deoxy-D-xylulose-5-phosphate reductoisomerase [Chthoniobacterales bacterium]